jgi:N-acylneuraminate cytidylyltransferase/CMP-N,N'-diacetyllegionaminic acid synthase
VSVSESESQHPVFQFKKNKKEIIKKLFFKKIKYLNRQNLKKVYYLDGSLYISKVKSFLSIKDFITNNKTIGFLSDKIKSFEIDDDIDFFILKNLLQLNR